MSKGKLWGIILLILFVLGFGIWLYTSSDVKKDVDQEGIGKSGKTKRATLQKRRVSKSTKTTRTRKTVSPVLSCMTKAHRFLFV